MNIIYKEHPLYKLKSKQINMVKLVEQSRNIEFYTENCHLCPSCIDCEDYETAQKVFNDISKRLHRSGKFFEVLGVLINFENLTDIDTRKSSLGGEIRNVDLTFKSGDRNSLLFFDSRQAEGVCKYLKLCKREFDAGLEK